MPFNFDANTARSSDFIPFAKYNAKSGRWHTKDDAGGEREVGNMTAVFDIENIRSGWFYYAEGQAPDVVYDIGTDILAPPSTLHKRGFAVYVYSQKELGGVREFSATSNVVIAAMMELRNAFLAAPEAKQGKVPVVTCNDTKTIKSKYGLNYQPVLSIVRWVDRPAALPNPGNSANDTPPFPASGSRQAEAGSLVEEVPPPVIPIRMAPQPATAPADEEAF